MMDSDERQQLFDGMLEYYWDMFRAMSAEQRALWFFTMDESVILSFWVGEGQTPAAAEQKHAVKLLAIAHALMALPCADAERSTIDDLLKMGFAAQERAESPEQKVD